MAEEGTTQTATTVPVGSEPAAHEQGLKPGNEPLSPEEAAWDKHAAEGAENDESTVEAAEGAAQEQAAAGKPAESGEQAAAAAEGAAAAQAGAPDEGAAAAAEAGKEGAEKPGQAAEGDPQHLDPPPLWSLEHQERFRKLDQETQQFLLERNKDMDAAHTKRSQEIAPLRNTAQKWGGYLQQLNTPMEVAFDNLMTHEHALRTGTPEQKRQVLMGLAQQYGVDMAAPGAGAPGNGAGNGAEDPFQIRQQINEAVQPLQQQVQQMGQHVQQQAHGSQEAARAAVQTQIQAFTEEKDAAGKLAHPYFQEVQEIMTQLAQARNAQGQTWELPELYDQACWASPTVREKMQAASSHQTNLGAQRAEEERVRKAKAASGGLAGEGAGSEQAQPKDMDAAVAAAYNQHAA